MVGTVVDGGCVCSGKQTWYSEMIKVAVAGSGVITAEQKQVSQPQVIGRCLDRQAERSE